MDSIITKQAAKVISVNGNAFIKVNGKDVPITEVLDLNAGTEIFIPEGANALLSLEDGTMLPVGKQGSPAQDILGSPLDDEITAIQALIEDGVDPTEALEATAAGGTPSSSGSQAPVAIARIGEETIAQAGFDTQASARSFLTEREVREDNDDSSFAGDDGTDTTEPTIPPINATFTLSSSADGENVTEGGQITYTVTVSQATQEDITITLSNGESILVPAGETTGSVVVNVREDDLFKQDNDELTVTIEEISDNSFDSSTPEGTVTNMVVDDSDTVTIKLFVTDAQGNILVDDNGIPVTTSSIVEGGNTFYVAHIVDSEGNIIENVSGEVTINFSELANTDGQKDYSQSGSSITVNLGEQISANTIDDVLTENDESFEVSVSLTERQKEALNGVFESVIVDGVVSNTITDDRGTGSNTDIDEDTTATFAVSGQDSVKEDGNSYLKFTVSLGNKVNADVAFTPTTGVDGDDNTDDAIAGTDYETKYYVKEGDTFREATADDFVIKAGETAKDIYVRVIDDKLAENTESLVLTASTTSALVEGSKTDSDTGTITDDRGTGSNTDIDEDTTATFAVSGQDSVKEDGNSYLKFTVSLGNKVNADVAFTPTTGVDGDDNTDDAIAGTDYETKYYVKEGDTFREATADDFVIKAGETAKDIYVRVIDDKLAENTESLVLTASTTSALVEGSKTDSDTGTITDKDPLIITTTPIKLSEEGLNSGIKDTTVSEDTVGDPGDTKVDNGDNASMKGKVTLNVEDPSDYVIKFAVDDSGAPMPSSYPLEINGNDCSIYWSFENNILVGHQNGVKVVSIELTSTPNAHGEFEYTVTLHDSIAHPLTDEGGQGIEDVLTNINVGINVYENGNESSGKELNSTPSLIDISVDDDMVDLSPEINFVEAKVNKSDNSEIIKDFSEFTNGTQTSLKLGIDGNNITFTAVNKHGSKADLKVTGQGLGVLSKVPGDGNDNEIEFDDGRAETVIGSLENIAHSISLKLGNFADGGEADDNESGVIVFYRNGIPIASYTFEEADLLNRPESEQTGVISFDIPAGFDEFHITPTISKGDDDDSDFTLVGISVSNEKSEGLATANGKINVNYGADGEGTPPIIYSMANSEAYSFVKNSNSHWSIKIKDSDVILGDVYLEESGDWSFIQYAPIHEDITFKVQASDADGDTDKVAVTIKPSSELIGSTIIETSEGIQSVKMLNDGGYVDNNYGSNIYPWIDVNGESLGHGSKTQIGDGHDYIDVGNYNDHVESGVGNDFILLGDSGQNAKNFSKGELFAKQAISEIAPNGEDSHLGSTSYSWADFGNGGAGDDRIYGQSGIDLVLGGSGNDFIDGGADNDYLRGGSGDDSIHGGSENDWLRGESGNDTLKGGTGKDTYVWGSGDADLDETWVDTITDFNISEGDTLSLGDLLQADSVVTATDHNGSIVISIDIDGNGDIEQHIVLDGITVDNGRIVINTSNGDLTITDSDNTVNSTNYTIVMPDDQ
ncbi:retention module-containing protein [Grimontia marina]|uniref:Hemolysin, chromosomal n=1 Tax=Grimontia marina TaxID=646534 RepID=A0A128EWM8_9GAMM|nr:retention module-containing protein [Grimontia marina]CZF78953.1 Hemolysin, chromosomal [Grimontia marina]